MSNSPLVNDLRRQATDRVEGGGVCSKIIASLLMLGAVSSLTGCQGLSSGSSDPAQRGTISLTNPSLAFGSVKAGASKTVSTAATNSGSAAVTINTVAISTKYFNLTSPSLPVTIAAGQSVPLSVAFTPNAAGTFNGSVSISSTAADSVTTLALSGTGTPTETTAGQLALSPGSASFGNVTVGSSRSSAFMLTNSGGTSVAVSQVSIGGVGFQISGITAPATLNPSQSMTFSVAFAPQVTGSATGSITIASNASDPMLTIPLSGNGTTVTTAGQLVLNPGNESFGNVAVGSRQSATITLTNSGGTTVNVSQASISGAGFQIGGITAPMTLNASQSMTFSVAFAPQATGSATGSVILASNASNPTLTIPLSGTGTNTVTTTTAQLGVTPATLGLGNVVVGTSGTASGSLSASGGSVTVTGASSNNSVFVIGGISLPVTIPAGQSIPFTVTFSPQVSGTAGATSIFASNAQPSSTTESLTGNGLPAPTHSVNLSWAASTSANISGYNVYRAPYATSCGTFKKLNTQLNTGTLYTDSTVTDGASYCYAATTVNSSSGESAYSNIVSNLQIPAP